MAFIPFTSFYDEHKKIWSGGKEEPLYHPDRSIGEVIFRNLKTYPNNVLQISHTEGTTLTTGEVLTSAIRIAQHFKKMGLEPVDIIGIIGLSTTYVLPLAVACFFNCTPFHSINPIYDEKSMTYITELTKPKLIFCDAQFYDKVKLVTKSFKPMIYTLFERIKGVPSVLDLLKPTKTELLYRPQPLTLGADQTIAILCSSGTTGLPKAVCIANSRMNINIDFINSEDVIFSTSGIDWITGLFIFFLSCLLGCKRIISKKPFSSESLVEIVQKHKVTIIVLPPRYVSAFVKCPTATPEILTTVRLFCIGGGYIALTTLQTLQSIVQNATINFNYGATETGNITMNFGLDKSTSTGRLSKGMRARIVDETGQNLEPNEIGEICVDHGYTWKGYYNDPKTTLASRDSEGWFYTGDLGYFDADHFLYIVDRKKDILKYMGLHFWPSEIEKCIMALPQVVEACVFGIYDESCGDKAGALVVKTKNSALSEQDVKDYVAKVLIGEHKQLNAGVLFVDKLPVNNNGKTSKHEAKKVFLNHLDRV